MKRYYLITLIWSIVGLTGCINTPADAEECFDVEKLRCEMRGRCYENFDVEGCKYYYKEQCRAREIVPDYTDEQMQACLRAIAEFGETNSQCRELGDWDEKEQSELCKIEDLAACAPIACEEVYGDGDEDGDDNDDDDDGDDDTATSEGLGPG